MALRAHDLDRSNLKIDFESFWQEVAKSVKSEFVQLAVLTPLSLFCGPLELEVERWTKSTLLSYNTLKYSLVLT